MQTRDQYKLAQVFHNLFAGGDHGFGLIDKTKPSGYDFKHYAPPNPGGEDFDLL